jgi:transposase
MTTYCGIDLHSNNSVIVVIDEQDRRLVEVRVANDLQVCLSVLEPYRSSLEGVAVESTFNWYWLVDGLMDHGYQLHLVHTAEVCQYKGLKHTDDQHDAFWLAHLMRLSILPTGYIYPRPLRWVRDLLRKRLSLVRTRTGHILSLESRWARLTGENLSVKVLRDRLDELNWDEPCVDLTIDCDRQLILTLDSAIKDVEGQIRKLANPRTEAKLLRTIPGVGELLSQTIDLEVGDIRRFPRVGCFSSYCRCVKSERRSNHKKKGENNRRNGNRYLSWAFSEAAHFAVRYDDRARRYYDRKRARTKQIVAIRAVANKLARASFYILRDRVPYDSQRLFG